MNKPVFSKNHLLKQQYNKEHGYAKHFLCRRIQTTPLHIAYTCRYRHINCLWTACELLWRENNVLLVTSVTLCHKPRFKSKTQYTWLFPIHKVLSASVTQSTWVIRNFNMAMCICSIKYGNLFRQKSGRNMIF